MVWDLLVTRKVLLEPRRPNGDAEWPSGEALMCTWLPQPVDSSWDGNEPECLLAPGLHFLNDLETVEEFLNFGICSINCCKVRYSARVL